MIKNILLCAFPILASQWIFFASWWFIGMYRSDGVGAFYALITITAFVVSFGIGCNLQWDKK